MRRNNQDGISIIEILLAVAVAAIFLVAMLSAITRANANAQFAKNQAQAGLIIQKNQEQMRSQRDQLGWASLVDQNTSATDGMYTVVTNVYTIPTTPPIMPSQKRITVTVSWSDGKGSHTLDGVTFLTLWK